MSTDQEPTPSWAQSVDAFASAQRQSVASTSATPIQFPDTSQLGGLCGNLLGGSAFTGGLVGAGDSSQGSAGALVTGSQSTMDTLCGLLGGSGSDTSPQTLVSGATDVHGAVNGSPMASGTIALGQNGSPSGNTALDAINGFQNFSNSMFNILSACGCGAANSPANASPQQIIDTTQATADGVTASPMASGIIQMGQTTGGSGNVALDALNGGQLWANGLFSILQACGCANANAPANVSPQQITATAQDTANAVQDSPMAAGMVTLGQQQSGPSGNVAVDAINGGNFFASTLYSLLSLCGCFGGGADPATATPQQVLTTADQTARAIAADPIASAVIAAGEPGSGGNAVIAAMNGAIAATIAIQDDVTAAATLAQQGTNAIALQAINNANYHAVDPTLNAVFNITSLVGGAPDTITVTREASVIGFINLPTATTKTYAVLVGYTSGSVTGAYVNIYSVNPATGALTYLEASTNLIGQLSGSLGWVYDLLTPSVAVEQGTWLAVEFAITGTGSVTMVGLPNHWLPANPNVFPQQLAAQRATDVFDGSVVFGGVGSISTGSWTHVIGALTSAVALVINAAAGGGSPAATVGGQAMSLLSTNAYTGGALYVFIKYGPLTGSQTVAFSGLTASKVSAVSISLNGITGAGTPATSSGSGTALSQSATGTVGRLMLQAFGYATGEGTISAYSQPVAGYEPGQTSNREPLIVGYVPATGSSQAFTGTGSVSAAWGAVTIPLTGVLPALDAPGSIASPIYSPNVPWLALSSQVPPPTTLIPPAAPAMVLTGGIPFVDYPGAPQSWPFVSSAATLTLNAVYTIWVYTGSGAADWTLPDAATHTGLVLVLYNRGTAPVTVHAAGMDHLDSSGVVSTTLTLGPTRWATLASDGTYWLNFG